MGTEVVLGLVSRGWPQKWLAFLGQVVVSKPVLQRTFRIPLNPYSLFLGPSIPAIQC